MREWRSWCYCAGESEEVGGVVEKDWDEGIVVYGVFAFEGMSVLFETTMGV